MGAGPWSEWWCGPPGFPASRLDLDDLGERFPSLSVWHLTVDTNSDFEKDWFVIHRVDRSGRSV